MRASERLVVWGAAVLGVLLGASGCGSDSAAGSGGAAGTGGAAGGGGAAGTGGAAGAAGSGGITTTIETAKGSVTIAQYDPTIPVDCSTTLMLDGVEDESTPWQCPNCAKTFRAPRNVTSTTCPPSDKPAPDMAFGWGADGRFYFGTGTNPVLELGTATEQSGTATVTIDASVPNGAGGTMKFTGSGSLTLGTTEDDVLHGWRASSTYSCGWPKTDPPPFTGSYEPLVGEQLPDGVFTDQCGDKVRMRDLIGRYLVIHANQTTEKTCPPCDLAAKAQKQFEDALAADGIDTLVVTLLAPAYTEANLIPTLDDVKSYLTWSGAGGVALADRGFATTVINHVEPGADGALGYPTFLVVAPDGRILSVAIGFNASATPTTWGEIESTIKTDAGK